MDKEMSEILVERQKKIHIPKHIKSILVANDAGVELFFAEAGRLGRSDSAELDFLNFTSGIIGAPYAFIADAVDRLQREYKLRCTFNERSR